MFTPLIGTTLRSVLCRRRHVEYLHLSSSSSASPPSSAPYTRSPLIAPISPPSTPPTPIPLPGSPWRLRRTPPTTVNTKIDTRKFLFALIGVASEFLVTCRFGTDENMFRYSLLSLYDEDASRLYLVTALLVTRACLALLIANTTTRLFFVISPFVSYRVAFRTVRGFDEAFEERFGPLAWAVMPNRYWVKCRIHKPDPTLEGEQPLDVYKESTWETAVDKQPATRAATSWNGLLSAWRMNDSREETPTAVSGSMSLRAAASAM
ncbi:hypothetical protein VF21_08152 [Pseudogymnoascus sp. 05NY08]|nr:hypothetical protein VF21_08152 [Pseudogymnoascus sp. 05NY08]